MCNIYEYMFIFVQELIKAVSLQVVSLDYVYFSRHTEPDVVLCLIYSEMGPKLATQKLKAPASLLY